MARRSPGRVRADLTFSAQVEALSGVARAALSASMDASGDDAFGALARYAEHVDHADPTFWSSQHACDEAMCCPDVRALRRTIANGLSVLPASERPPVVRLVAALDAATDSRLAADLRAGSQVRTNVDPSMSQSTGQRPTH